MRNQKENNKERDGPWTERLYRTLINEYNAIERGLIVAGRGSEEAIVIAAPVHAATIHLALEERCECVDLLDSDAPAMIYLVSTGGDNQ